MSQNIDLYIHRLGWRIEDLAEEIKKLALRATEEVEVIYRIKDPKTLEKKMGLKGTDDVFQIHDVYGFRILVSTESQVYQVLDVLKSNFSGFVDHDYIASPKVRSDRPKWDQKSLRLVQFVAYQREVPFEVQITTRSYHRVNETMHNRYHKEKYCNRTRRE